MEKKKILLVSSSSNLFSGASHSMIGLSRYLMECGNVVEVLLPRNGEIERKCLEAGIKCTIIKHYRSGWCREIHIRKSKIIFWAKEYVKRIYDFIAYWKIRKYLVDNKFDIVHVNAVTEGLVARVSMDVGIKTVWHIREFLEEDLYKTFFNPLKAYGIINRADCVIAISEAIKRKYQPYLSKSIEIVYNGIDVSKYFCQREILTQSTVNICIVGRISRAKGQEQLITAVEKLYKKGYVNLKVQIVGTPQYKDYFETLKLQITKSGIQDVFEFVSFTNNIEDYYKKADIVCVCSKKEAFGRVTIEGMTSGAIVIGANTGGTTELIEHQVTGLLYKEGNPVLLAEQIEWVINNKDGARKIAVCGQIRAKDKFSVENNGRNIMTIYERILAEK